MGRKTKVVCKVVGAVLVVLLLVGIVGIIFKFTNGGNEEFKTFYLIHDGEEIFAGESETAFKRGDTYRYDVKYTFDLNSDEPKDFSVKVMSYATSETEFSYKVDDKDYIYKDGMDLTAAFNVQVYATCFQFTIPEDMTMQFVLQAVTRDGKVEVPDAENKPGQYRYVLVVSNYNQSVIYRIRFAFYQGVEGLALNEERVYL